jgi:hypothetical protein
MLTCDDEDLSFQVKLTEPLVSDLFVFLVWDLRVGCVLV